MPIEFPCGQCSHRLRVPEESAGKQARCPSCGGLTEIPAATDPGGSQIAETLPAGAAPDYSPPKPAADSGPINPYAPAAADTYAVPSPRSVAAGELRHSSIDFSTVLGHTWTIYSGHIGQFTAAGLIAVVILIAVAFGLGIASSMVSFAIAQSMGGVGPDNQAGFVIVQLAMGYVAAALQLPVTAWITAGFALMSVKAARGGQATVGDLFSCGSIYAPTLGFIVLQQVMLWAAELVFSTLPTIVVVLLGDPSPLPFVSLAGTLAVLIVSIIVHLYLLVTAYFIADRGLGSTEAMKASVDYMSGNKGAAFLILLVVYFVGGLFVIITCGIGSIFFLPYSMVLGAIVYMHATGQPVAAFGQGGYGPPPQYGGAYGKPYAGGYGGQYGNP